MTKAGMYSGSVLVSGWDGEENSTYVVVLGKKIGQARPGLFDYF